MTKYLKKKNRWLYLITLITLFIAVLHWFIFLEELSNNNSIFNPIVFTMLFLISIYNMQKKEYVLLNENSLYIPGILKRRWKFSEIGEITMNSKDKLSLFNNKMKNMVTFSLNESKTFLEEFNHISKKEKK